jgi:hypothetical protein
MSSDEKRMMAERLIELRGDLHEPGELDHLPVDTVWFRRKKFEMMVDLYEHNFTPETLQALLSFYQSKIGQSILASEKKIRQQLPSRIAALVQQLNAGQDALSELPPISGFRRKPK